MLIIKILKESSGKMPRPKRRRWIAGQPLGLYLKPQGIPLRFLEEVCLTLDEAEALRLADLEGNHHEKSGESLGVSRATFGRIVESARRKVAEAIFQGKALRIEGGVVQVVDQRTFLCADCGHGWQEPRGTGRPQACPQCGSPNFQRAPEERGGGRGRGGPGGAGGAGRGFGKGPGFGRGGGGRQF